MPKPVADIIGKTFYHLTVLERRPNNKHGGSVWLVRCVCGKEFEESYKRLARGVVQSCGCRPHQNARFHDITGQRFGRLVAIRRVEDYLRPGTKERHGNWECLCDCGNLTTATIGNLRNGNTSSCGCYLKERIRETQMVDMTGEQYGRLTVLCLDKETTRTKKGTWWVVQCSCGTVTSVSRDSLIGGYTRSCGCLLRESRINNIQKKTWLKYAELEGVRFGRLIVIAFVRKSFRGNVWRVRCECGNEKELVTSQLTKTKGTRSCGCLQRDVMAALQWKHGLTGTKEFEAALSQKRREQKKAVDSEWTPEMQNSILTYFGCCVVCGMTTKEHKRKHGTSLHVDHILPLSRGFGLKPGNAVVLCTECNSKKHNKLPQEWEPFMCESILSAGKEWQDYWYLESSC